MNLEEQSSQAFRQQSSYKLKMKNTSSRYRIDKLDQTKHLILKHQPEIEEALLADFGKSRQETALTEILPIVGMINLYKKNLASWMKPKKVGGGVLFFGTQSFISFEGKGNVLVISPWNYPFQLSLYPVLTSFCAGNTTILKPSEYTPKTNQVVRKILSEVFSKEEVTVIEGEVAATNSLMEFPFDHVFFTGSTPVGKIIMEKASRHLTSVSLELGGKSPAIICSGYDVDKAAKNLVWGKHVNSGQTCVAPDYILIESHSKTAFVESYKKYLAQYYGSSYQKNNDFCRIITPRHAERLKQMLEDAKSKGAVIEYGGHLFDNNKFEPTLLSNVTLDMEIMQEEIFGPILPIITMDSQTEMVQYINELDNPLAMYVFTENQSESEFFRENTHSGSLAINDSLIQVAHPNLPFGGAGKSGHGRYHGKAGFEEFSNQRAVVKRKFDSGTSYFYPPYTDNKKKLVDKLLSKFNKLF